MNKYYQNELDNLRVLATDFSREHPTLAPQLAAASTDPDVERILEGVAFLSAKIRQKIDDDFPEFSQGLLKQIFPHYLRPIPSATIVEFTPKPILKNKLTVNSGTYLDSTEVEGVNCRFRTCFDVDVWPISVEMIRQLETSTGKKYIEAKLKFNGIDISKWGADVLRIHLGGDYHGAVDLYYILLKYLDYVEVASQASSEPVRASAVKLQAVGIDNSQALLDYPSNSFPAYRLIQEYFLMKEKFLFLDVSGLNQYTSQLKGDTLFLRFYLDELPLRIPRLPKNRFVLHATPAVNLFTQDAETILNDHTRAEYRIRPLRDADGRYDIYSVDKVTGRNRKTAKMVDYAEIGLSDPGRNTKPVYHTMTRQTGDSGRVESFIGFSYPANYPLDKQETLLVQLTCSNGRFPSSLKPGDVSKPTSGSSELVEFANLLQPSDQQQVPAGSSMLWRLLSHLSLNYMSLANMDNFKSLLELYIFSSSAGNKQEVANRKRIDGVENITVTPCDRLVRGMPMRGQAVEVMVNPSSFASRGDMYLFGIILDYLFASFSSINSFTEFSLKDSASDEIYEWPARVGDKPLI